MSHRTVTVALGERSYPVLIGAGLLESGSLLADRVSGSQAAVVTNDVVAPLYLARVLSALPGRQVDVFTLPDGERHKTLERYAELQDFLVRKRHNRTTTVIALGGGVVGDLAGFAAATFQRGVAFVQVPTTLLAQVDSSVGGKTAVNHPEGKNLIGAFYQPRAVLADTDTLATLPDRELRAGLAEVLKYGIIADADFFGWLERSAGALLSRDGAALATAIERSVTIKADIVARDERESGLRAVLNFGHTFAHAIESLTGYTKFLHGEAVGIGMVMAADLSARQRWLAPADARRIKAAVAALKLATVPPTLGADAMLRAMSMDKKVVDGKLRLVLVPALGRATVTEEVDPSALSATLSAAEALCDG